MAQNLMTASTLVCISQPETVAQVCWEKNINMGKTAYSPMFRSKTTFFYLIFNRLRLDYSLISWLRVLSLSTGTLILRNESFVGTKSFTLAL